MVYEIEQMDFSDLTRSVTYDSEMICVKKGKKPLYYKVLFCGFDIETTNIVDGEKKEGAHALLAIGIEVDSDENIAKILCLDPGNPSPKYSSWNCFIDVSKETKTDYPFYCVSEYSHYKVRLDDMLIIDIE